MGNGLDCNTISRMTLKVNGLMNAVKCFGVECCGSQFSVFSFVAFVAIWRRKKTPKLCYLVWHCVVIGNQAHRTPNTEHI